MIALFHFVEAYIYLLEVFIKVLIQRFSNNNKLHLHDYNEVLQYCKIYLNLIIDSFLNKIFKIIWNILIIAYFQPSVGLIILETALSLN